LDELLASKVDLLVVSGPPLTRVVHDAIKTLPIVTFDLESDPVESGWLQSYARPGGNLTGVFSDFPDFSTKWLQPCGSLGPVDATSAAEGGCCGRAVDQRQNRSS
jgi:putative ABC transport system substrate-binding protein